MQMASKNVLSSKATSIVPIDITWPEVFVNENFEYDTENPDIKLLALTDGLTGWGNCNLALIPGSKFANGMAKIEKLLEVSASPNNLNKIACRYKDFGLDDLRAVAHQQYEKNPDDPSNIIMTQVDMSKMMAKKIKVTW